MAEAQIAFIGGTGLYDIEGLAETRRIDIETPFGAPSDSIVVGTLGKTRVAFLSRHGRGHRLIPTEIPFRANIYALKTLGVERIISVSAVGSLREEIEPQDLLVPDQLIDRTTRRVSTFFGDGVAAHVELAEPFCPELRAALLRAAGRLSVRTHPGGTCVVIEGPQFSTRAESHFHRSVGASVIGMTGLPEARLAREAEMCYATLALVTDYDCWHQSEEAVSVELIVSNLRRCVSSARQALRGLVETIPGIRQCACGSALKDAIITSPDMIPKNARRRLSAIVDKYLDTRTEAG